MSSHPTAPILSKTTDPKNTLAEIGLRAVAASLEEFLARVTKARLSPRQMLEEIARLELVDKAQRSLQRF